MGMGMELFTRELIDGEAPLTDGLGILALWKTGLGSIEGGARVPTDVCLAVGDGFVDIW